ncbi:MAG: NADPH-dependent assimilatory sulfite reductase hemoprotein subunit [Phototrophicales bacterium]|nr:NADPH-dependent assimilatory sulfite reductase hemoprotein subunit [Phototrophicales bacterium]
MAKLSVEEIKLASRNLRGSILEELKNSALFFTSEAEKLLKFHGIYEQEDRDKRKLDRTTDHHQVMIRAKLPGGQLTPEQYLAMDDIADNYANGTLRITTRQTFQLHGVLKSELRETIQAMNHALVTTLGACGDIVRNVLVCPAPTTNPQQQAVQEFAFTLNEALYPQTRAYHQIFLDDTQLIDDSDIIEEEPIYGHTYLPRKFKIAIAYAGDNCVDIYTNDVGLVAVFDGDTLAGFNLLAGGGMGMTHNNDETFPRLADDIAFIRPEHVLEAVTAIVTIHRDYGSRENRKHARLKYILHDKGVDWFREELARRVSFLFDAPRPVQEFEVYDHLGWHEQDNGQLFLGVYVENGRIIDRENARMRSGLRTIIEQFNLSVRLTCQQNLLLTNINPADRPAIEAMIADYGIRTVEKISKMRRNALACVAMPTCGLAITEAERVFPQIISEFEDALDSLNIGDSAITARMTGCPNGCARPYVAEIAFVGRSLEKYTVFLGGNPNGTRLAKNFLDLVHITELVPTLTPILRYYRDCRNENEAFGDFVMRVGFDVLHALVNDPDVKLATGD